MPVITTFGGMSARGFGLFSGGALQLATSFITITGTTTTNTVPVGYNAIHIQAAVGGGGGSVLGADYDKAGGESSGSGGGSGAYISDKIFSVAAGETLTLVAGTGGAAGNYFPQYNVVGNDGTNTQLSGSITGPIFTITAGGGASGTGGGVQGPLRSNAGGSAGTQTIPGTAITSGSYNQSGIVVSVTTCTGGPLGSFNQSGNGAVGNSNGNCGGDNCQIAGSTGAPSYAGVIAGGAGSPQGSTTPGQAGTRGSGGGGGGAQVSGGRTFGGGGGNGEIQYRFLQVKQ
jgi:hypothetical protein